MMSTLTKIKEIGKPRRRNMQDQIVGNEAFTEGIESYYFS